MTQSMTTPIYNPNSTRVLTYWAVSNKSMRFPVLFTLNEPFE